MGRAEEAMNDFCTRCFKYDRCAKVQSECTMADSYQEGYIEGYHQAEKDLELTWEDIPKILHICEQLKTRWWFRDDEQTKQIGKQPFWEEVLKQFKEKGKEHGK